MNLTMKVFNFIFIASAFSQDVYDTCDSILNRLWLNHYMIEWGDFLPEADYCVQLENDNTHWYLSTEEQRDHYCRHFTGREDLDFNEIKKIIFEDWKKRNNLSFNCEKNLF